MRPRRISWTAFALSAWPFFESCLVVVIEQILGKEWNGVGNRMGNAERCARVPLRVAVPPRGTRRGRRNPPPATKSPTDHQLSNASTKVEVVSYASDQSLVPDNNDV